MSLRLERKGILTDIYYLAQARYRARVRMGRMPYPLEKDLALPLFHRLATQVPPPQNNATIEKT